MRALIHPFVQIILLRMNPQDLPASGMLLALALIAHAAAGAALASVNLRFDHALTAGVVETALMCGLTAGLLMLRTLSERIIQTLTALAGAGALVGFVAFPVAKVLHIAYLAREPDPVFAVLLLVLLGWSLVVSAHIFRHAVSVPYYVGVLIAVAFYWISVRVLGGLFPFTA